MVLRTRLSAPTAVYRHSRHGAPSHKHLGLLRPISSITADATIPDRDSQFMFTARSEPANKSVETAL